MTPEQALEIAASGLGQPLPGTERVVTPAPMSEKARAQLAFLNRGSPVVARAYLRGTMLGSTTAGFALKDRRYLDLEIWLAESLGLH